ncbi:hypothetical protein A2U01_0099634, partial [Trifolium medium]|nr:hypothetical protein [Trifolium medium]
MNKYRYGLRGDIAYAVSLQSIANFGDLIQKVKEFSSKGKQAQPSQTPRPCPDCGKSHSGECMKGKG